MLKSKRLSSSLSKAIAETVITPRKNVKSKSSRKDGKETSSLSKKLISDYFPCRSTGSKWVGAHVSAANGLQNSVLNSVDIKANAFALFVRSQRKWTSPDLKDEVIESFKEACHTHNYTPAHILPHGSYLINLGNPDKEKRKKSYEAFLDELQRCEKLGLNLYNFHPGSTVGDCSIKDSIQYIAECINNAHSKTDKITIVLENMAGQGNVVGSKFEELADIINLVKDKSRIGVCIDTCHAFAAGYDLRTKESFLKVMQDFESIIGFKYLRGIHLNDSIEELGSNKDRHANIGKGKIGLECFKTIMNDERFNNIPMVLETPPYDGDDFFHKEIELLYSLVDKKHSEVVKGGNELNPKRNRNKANKSLDK